MLEYVKTEKPAPDGIEPHFRRGGYIHPVFTPTGQELTGDFPPDHAHQHALFFAPMVDGPFKIAPGKEYVSRYRYLVTSDALDVNKIEKHWKKYSKPNRPPR